MYRYINHIYNGDGDEDGRQALGIRFYPHPGTRTLPSSRPEWGGTPSLRVILPSLVKTKSH